MQYLPFTADSKNLPDATKPNDAGVNTPVSRHSFRATGITVYLENNGTLETTQKSAAHESLRTTKLYDRTDDQLTLDELEQISV